MAPPSPPAPPRAAAALAATALAALLGLAAACASGLLVLVPPPPPAAEAAAGAVPRVPSRPTPPVAEPPPLQLEARVVRLERDRTFGEALAGLGLDGPQAAEVVAALAGQLDFARLRPGGQLRLERVAGERALRRLSFRQGPADEWIVERREGGGLAARKRPVALATEVARVEVEIASTLVAALQRAGEDPALAVLASDLLAWDVDFYQDVRRGDRLRVLVEKVYADGRLLRLGEVQAVEYQGEVARRRLYRWTDPEGQPGAYDDDGASARRGFLKSPLKFAHLTSRFGSRRHPVLGYTRAHQGVDYAAPVGTPIWAVADGTVTEAGTRGACGKMVTLRHRNGLATQYCHLSAIAVRPGDRVAQKQVIGATGQTGLATGPHLHYAVLRGGVHLNPLQLQLPREAPVPERWRAEFARAVAPLRSRLDGGGVAAQ